MDKPRAVIIGAGDGLSASLARELARDHSLTLAARSGERMKAVAEETGADTVLLDATDEAAVKALFDASPTPPRVVIYNPSMRVRGPVADLAAEDVRRAVEVTAIGAFLAGKHAARRMLGAEPVAGCRGTILFTGASAGVKGYPQSAPFAMGKFGLRGLAQSMARELAPKNIHVAHFVIDGGIGRDNDPRAAGRGEDGMLDPDAIARTYLHIHRQHRSAWTWEVELRPWVENF